MAIWDYSATEDEPVERHVFSITVTPVWAVSRRELRAHLEKAIGQALGDGGITFND